jgi:Fe-S oxidoreductase
MRLAQALDTGAQILATACQQCKRTLAAQARKDRVRLRVVDVAELLWQALRP